MVELARRLPIRSDASRLAPCSLLLVAACIFLVVGSLQHDLRAADRAGLAQGGVFGSLALALVLIYRATEVINFAQGEMAMATVYIAYQLIAVGPLLLAGVLPHARDRVRARRRHPAACSSARCSTSSVIAVVIVTVGLFILIDGLVDVEMGRRPSGSCRRRSATRSTTSAASRSRGRTSARSRSRSSRSSLLWAFFRFTKLGLGDARRGAAAGRGARSSACASTGCSRSAGASPPCSARSRA